MSDTFTLALLAGILAGLPVLLLFIYRKTIPQGVLWAAILCSFAMPVVGWLFGLYVALKDWD